MRSLALAAYIVVLGLFGVLIANPYLERKHDTPAAVPSPSPLAFTSLDVVPAGKRLCMSNVAITRQSEQVRFRAGSYGKPGPALRVTVNARGYAAAVPVRGGWEDNIVQTLSLPRPPRDELVTVCIRNAGRSKIALYAADDNAKSRAHVTLGGKIVEPTPELSFWERRPESIAENADVTAGRIATFRGIFGHTWIVWTLFALTVIGVPLLVGGALWAGTREQ